jgi:hypothetical protein
MTEFLKCDADMAGILCDVEYSSYFCFGCRGHYMFDDDTGDVYSSVGRFWMDWVMLAAEVENATTAGPCLGLREIGRVAVDGKNHGAGREANFCVGVGAGIVKELVQ